MVDSWISPRLPLRFDQFQHAALYDPDHGFYGAGRGRAGGRGGDFLTSAEVGPLFGAVLARYIDRVWSELGAPRHFTVVEAGAGRGTLARSIIAARPRSEPDYVAVELSSQLRADHPAGVISLAELPQRSVGAGVVIANELLDNLPVRLVELGGEVWVGAGGEELRPSELALPIAGRVPVAAASARWVEQARAVVAAGAVVAFDYGVRSTAELAERPWQEWLRTYRGHDRGDPPWFGPGSQDITCEVPFDQLPVARSLVRQAQWLADNGIDELVEDGRRVWAERAQVGDLESLRARSRIREAEALTDATGLGAFWVAEWDPTG